MYTYTRTHGYYSNGLVLSTHDADRVATILKTFAVGVMGTRIQRLDSLKEEMTRKRVTEIENSEVSFVCTTMCVCVYMYLFVWNMYVRVYALCMRRVCAYLRVLCQACVCVCICVHET
jgi:hypothetical protein